MNQTRDIVIMKMGMFAAETLGVPSNATQIIAPLGEQTFCIPIVLPMQFMDESEAPGMMGWEDESIALHPYACVLGGKSYCISAGYGHRANAFVWRLEEEE